MKVFKLTLLTILVGILLPIGARAAESTNAEGSTTTLDQRLQQYSTSYPVKLTEKEKTQLPTTCVIAQANLKKIYDRVAPTNESRKQVYSTIDSRYDAVHKRLTLQQLDTSTIDLLMTNYRKQTTSFYSSLTSFQQILQDASTMDCAANPSGFRSALEAVRIARKNVADNSLAVGDVVKTDAKMSFDSIKKRLDEEQK